jgi:predicted PurR-regulated permease PerM
MFSPLAGLILKSLLGRFLGGGKASSFTILLAFIGILGLGGYTYHLWKVDRLLEEQTRYVRNRHKEMQNEIAQLHNQLNTLKVNYTDNLREFSKQVVQIEDKWDIYLTHFSPNWKLSTEAERLKDLLNRLCGETLAGGDCNESKNASTTK